jgi:hypothetical protein
MKDKSLQRVLNNISVDVADVFKWLEQKIDELENEIDILESKIERIENQHEYCGFETSQPNDESYAKPKQEMIEKAAENNWDKINYRNGLNPYAHKIGFIEGAKWGQEISYSEEDLEVAFFEGRENNLPFIEWFKQFKNK